MFAVYRLFLNQPGYSVECCTPEQKQQRVTRVSSANEPIGCAVEQIH